MKKDKSIVEIVKSVLHQIGSEPPRSLPEMIDIALGNPLAPPPKPGPYHDYGESLEFESPDDPKKRYKILKVETRSGEADASECYTHFQEGEWRIVDLTLEKVVMTFPWRNNDDSVEMRHFRHGPIDIVISEDETELRCYYTMEHTLGFKFEGKDDPASYESYKLPPDENVSTESSENK